MDVRVAECVAWTSSKANPMLQCKFFYKQPRTAMRFVLCHCAQQIEPSLSNTY